MSALARLCRLGILIPATLAGSFVTDVTLRLLPHDLFSFRAWEAVRTPGEDAPFLPSHRYHSDRAYGNLAAIGNLPGRRVYRPLTFTTDALGYPNPPGLAERGGVDAIVFGSSFAAGSELGDGKTLVAELGRVSGRTVYNAAGGDPSFAEILPLARRLVVPGGLVIFEYPEARDLPEIRRSHVSYKTARCRELLQPSELARLCPALGWIDRHARVSPLQILCQRAVKRLETGRWLPNPYASYVLVEPLRNDGEMLFLAEERAFLHRGGQTGPAVRSFRWLGEKLRRERFTLLVVLTPRKYTVYAPLLVPPDPGPDESRRYLDGLERGLRAAGVPVVNLLTPLRAAADTSLAGGSHVYFPDDTHWNPAGAAVAAAEIWRAWQRLESHRGAR